MRIYSEPLPPGNDYLPDGRKVHWQRTEFDCMPAVIATALQCEYEEVPPGPADPYSEEQCTEAVTRLEEWLAEQGWRVTAKSRPFNHYVWLGSDLHPTDPTMHHIVLGSFQRVVFDPALAFPLPPGCHVQPTTKIDATWVFERIGAADGA